MPSALVAALTAPLRELQSMVGPGWFDDPTADPAVVLGGVRNALAEVSAAAGRSWSQAGAGWWGAGADGAADYVTATVAAIDELAARADRLSAAAEAASAAVASANRRLRDIVEDFEARAAVLEQHPDSPALVARLVAQARRALAEAVAVVEELEAELDTQVAAVNAPTHAPAPAATAPAGSVAPSMPSTGSGLGGVGGGVGGGVPMSPLSGAGGMPLSGAGGMPRSGLGSLADFALPQAPPELPTAATFGDGVAIRLPDGSTATAPNAVAASAVRHALTQLGVPYDWGGTTPGVGLDCSGLTQWAYHEAGLSIPRLAQEQDVGAAVPAGSLRPGDLAVWDGHVAMIVGNGIMIEAGDPVQLSPIRTANAGQGFQGFWRPTA